MKLLVISLVRKADDITYLANSDAILLAYHGIVNFFGLQRW